MDQKRTSELNLPTISLCCDLIHVEEQSQRAQTLLLAEIKPREVFSLLMDIQSAGPDEAESKLKLSELCMVWTLGPQHQSFT